MIKERDALVSRNFWGTLKSAYGYKRRSYVDKIFKEAKNSNISAVMGVRRSGKSTILTQVLEEIISSTNLPSENTLFINFEDPRLSELLVDNNLLNFLLKFYDEADNRSTIYFFLDEIQNVENWQGIIRTPQDTLNILKTPI